MKAFLRGFHKLFGIFRAYTPIQPGQAIEQGSSYRNTGSDREIALLKLLHEQNIHLKPRVLIVEDEPLIALALEEALLDLGFSIVGSVSQIPEALDFISREEIDVALLDVNLGIQKIDPVADVLAERHCPFVFTTGYDRSGLPRAHSHRAVLEKPFHTDDLAGAVCAELEGQGWHVSAGPNP